MGISSAYTIIEVSICPLDVADQVFVRGLAGLSTISPVRTWIQQGAGFDSIALLNLEVNLCILGRMLSRFSKWADAVTCVV